MAKHLAYGPAARLPIRRFLGDSHADRANLGRVHARAARMTSQMHLGTGRVGNLRLIATPIRPGSLAVRFMADDRRYHAVVNASPLDGGKIIHLSSHLATRGTLTPEEWIEAQSALFPDAEAVLFERLLADGTFSHRRLQLPR